MRKRIYLMCGIPGSGKTTLVSKHAKPGVSAHISRDRIRFSMVKETEEYFSRETEVFNAFCEQVAQALQSPWVDEVWVDATHLNAASRNKTLRGINQVLMGDITDYDVICIVCNPPLEVCLERNAKRKGRECVPEKVVCNMYNSLTYPTEKEAFAYFKIAEMSEVPYV